MYIYIYIILGLKFHSLGRTVPCRHPVSDLQVVSSSLAWFRCRFQVLRSQLDLRDLSLHTLHLRLWDLSRGAPHAAMNNEDAGLGSRVKMNVPYHNPAPNMRSTHDKSKLTTPAVPKGCLIIGGYRGAQVIH